MFQELRATGLRYDNANDGATIAVESGAAAKSAESRVSLLLDKSGFLVGIDLGGEGLARTLVLLGTHESVKTTRDARVVVSRSSAGQVTSIAIDDARRAIRAHEANPYL